MRGENRPIRGASPLKGFKALSQFFGARPMMRAISRMVARFEISEPGSRLSRNKRPAAKAARSL